VKNDSEHQKLLLQFALRGIISYIIYSHYRQVSLSKRLHPHKTTLLIDQAFAYTAKHMNQPINISKMVRSLGTSRSTIDRVFLDTLQMTPSRALTRYKMQQSLALLQSGTSVKETSQVLGYSSTFHFSNTFKMVFGKSPRKYLESL
jgi:AraC-like DNA-binding protein